MVTWESASAQVFPVHRQYLWLAGGLGALSLYEWYAFGQTQDPGLLVMALICSGLTLWHGQWAGAQVLCDVENLTLRRWGKPAVTLHWDQVHRMSLAGRLTRSLLVEYGDPAFPDSLLLPKLQRQDELLDTVAGSIRKTPSMERK